MSRLLAIGECMVELAPCEDGRYKLGFAGDTFNTAWYARRLGPPELEVAYFSSVGDDELSHQMARFMENAGIVPDLRIQHGKSVGLYMITLKDGERGFAYWRGASAARSLADGLDVFSSLEAGDIAYFSGITLAILPEAGRQRLLAALRRARDCGVTVAFDPNLRPRLWAGAADMRHWITEGARVSDIVLPSHDEEASLFGDADIGATAARYLDSGSALVVVKDGPRAVRIRSNEIDVLVYPEPMPEVVDTTAAGDSFNAGFLTQTLIGSGFETSAEVGCEVAREVIAVRGALVPVRGRRGSCGQDSTMPVCQKNGD